jgi:hypothetical protein
MFCDYCDGLIDPIDGPPLVSGGSLFCSDGCLHCHQDREQDALIDAQELRHLAAE